MNKKIVLPLAMAIAAIMIGVTSYSFSSQYFDLNKHHPNLFVPNTATFKTNGSKLLDPCNSPIILKGVNKLAVFDSDDPVGNRYFAAIDSSGANCVRIVWEINNDKGQMNPLTRLDQLITNAKVHKLIPIVGLWDYTNDPLDGGFSHLLTDYLSFWTRPDVVKLIKKHEAYLIVNIANEAANAAENGGDENNSTDQNVYANRYKQVVSAMRKKGINVPLMIDGMDRGKSLHCFAVKGPEMLTADPQHNLIFSFHPYWPQSDTDGTTFIKDKFDEVSKLPTPITIVIGELAGFGAWPGSPDINICSPAGQVDYAQFAQLADKAGIGWLMWEWGPGANWKVPGDCPQLNMTTNGTYQSIINIPSGAPNWWVHDLAIDQLFSLKHAHKTPFMMNGFQPCPKP